MDFTAFDKVKIYSYVVHVSRNVLVDKDVGIFVTIQANEINFSLALDFLYSNKA
jgi:hypothetical protein